MNSSSPPTTSNVEQEPSLKYERLHPEIYTFSKEFLDPTLAEALDTGTPEALLPLLDMVLGGVFTFKCLRPEFCQKLIEELEHLEACGVPMVRPNSMNRYGAVLDQCGFKDFMTQFCEYVITPFAKLLFPKVLEQQDSSKLASTKDTASGETTKQEEVEDVSKKESSQTNPLPYHHAFTVRYALREDRKLDKHRDNSDVTLNICLGKPGFEGGHLLFQGFEESALFKVPKGMHRYPKEEQEYRVDHQVGTALIHHGRHIHQAVKLQAGERINLIIWTKTTPFLV